MKSIKSIKSIVLSFIISLILIIIWHVLSAVALFIFLVWLAEQFFGDLNRNEGFLILIPIGYGSFILGFLGIFPAYFSYKFLLKKLTARFGLQIDHPKRLFVFSALLIYGLPLLLLLGAIFFS